MAAKQGFRCRSAFKLKEIQQKHSLLSRNSTVLDLGAAPGGWSQVALNYGCRVVSVDLLTIKPFERGNSTIIKGDITQVHSMINDKFDIVLSDMAHSFTGNKFIDTCRVDELVQIGLDVCRKSLNNGGSFCCKYLQGSGNEDLIELLKSEFEQVVSMRPKAVRKESSESYFICKGFKH